MVGESIRVSPAVCSPWPCRGDAVLLFQPDAPESGSAFSFAPAHTQLCLADPPSFKERVGCFGSSESNNLFVCMQQKARKLDAVHFSVKYGIRLLLGGLGEEGRQNEMKIRCLPFPRVAVL